MCKTNVAEIFRNFPGLFMYFVLFTENCMDDSFERQINHVAPFGWLG
jgi:hypothetical protein